MKEKIIIIAILITLVSGSLSVNAVSLNQNVKPTVKTENTDADEIYVGKITINCDLDNDDAVQIVVEDSPYREINPQGTERAAFKFYLDWEILNPKLTAEEQYYFEIKLRDGNGPDDPVICTNSYTCEGTLTDASGRLYSDEISFGRYDFEKDSLLSKPDFRKIRAELRGKYYQWGNLIDADPDSDTGNNPFETVTRFELDNQPPTIPTLSSNDIQNGGTVKFGVSYTFTASSSTDPDGDSMLEYHFDFHDGTTNVIPYSEQGVSASHTWDGTDTTIGVTLTAYDRFGAQSPYVVWGLKTQARSTSKLFCLDIIVRYPFLFQLLKQTFNSGLLCL